MHSKKSYIKKYKIGDIYFWDNSIKKTDVDSDDNIIAGSRPVIIIKSSYYDKLVTVIPCSTKLTNCEYGFVPLRYDPNKEDRIGYPIFNQMTTIRSSELKKYYGRLKDDKIELLKKNITKFLFETDDSKKFRYPVEFVINNSTGFYDDEILSDDISEMEV